MSNQTYRGLGSVYTPPDFAQFLASWAITRQDDIILDAGFGDGVFISAAHQRLLQLGADVHQVQHQIYGAEIDIDAFEKCTAQFRDLGISFPYLYHGNFFDIKFPLVDVVIGNPPYVRRTYIENVDHIRQRVIEKNSFVSDADIPRLTDLYVYFMLQALSLLKVGGRVGIITADPWMNVGYGKTLKRYLQQHFEINSLVSLDRRVFADAQVKPVLLLAEKKESVRQNQIISFVRVKNGLPISALHQILHNQEVNLPDVGLSQIQSSELKHNTPWGVYFKAPEIYEEFESHPLMSPISALAETRIGIQTLGKDFFVLSAEKARLTGIEPEFLAPLAQSSRYFNEPIIKPTTPKNLYIFYCSKSKDQLQGTKALEYILDGEKQEVEVRGKNTTVIGYHEKERIKRSSRKYWYDLRTSLERRGRAAILIPRLVYQSFTVVWNQAQFVPGELFIEFLPLPLGLIDTEVYLAILSSSITEIMLRADAQVYGGGTYNINPGQIKKTPILNATLLDEGQKMRLKDAYMQYVLDEAHDRSVIDKVMFDILQLETSVQRQVREVLADLLLIASSTKKATSHHP